MDSRQLTAVVGEQLVQVMAHEDRDALAGCAPDRSHQLQRLLVPFLARIGTDEAVMQGLIIPPGTDPAGDTQLAALHLATRNAHLTGDGTVSVNCNCPVKFRMRRTLHQRSSSKFQRNLFMKMG